MTLCKRWASFCVGHRQLHARCSSYHRMSNTDKISEPDGNRVAYLTSCISSRLVAALDAADGLVQRKPEEGTNASAQMPPAVCTHMRAIQTGSNLTVTCRDLGSALQQNQPSRKEPIQVRARSVPTGTATTLNRTPPDGSAARTTSTPFKWVMGGGGRPVQRCRNAPSSAAWHTARALAASYSSRAACSSRLPCVAVAGHCLAAGVGERAGELGGVVRRGGVTVVLVRCRAVHIFPRATA